jgi:hypothetical protein
MIATTALTLVSALGCGLMAGDFFAFSTFLMKALARLPTAQGIAAMQSINRQARRGTTCAGLPPSSRRPRSSWRCARAPSLGRRSPAVPPSRLRVARSGRRA